MKFAIDFEKVAREAKQWACQNGPKDIAPMALAARGNDPVALVVINQHDPETILRVATTTAGGFDADQLGVIFETLIPREDPEHPELAHIDPRTGKTWARGALRKAFAEEDGIAAGLLREALMITAVNRAKDIITINIPFQYCCDGRHLTFLEAERNVLDSTTGRAKVMGVMTDTLLKAMGGKSLGHYLPPDESLDRETRDATTDAVLQSMGHAVHLLATTSRAERLRKMGYNTGD
jgi:hypothetical protein